MVLKRSTNLNNFPIKYCSCIGSFFKRSLIEKLWMYHKYLYFVYLKPNKFSLHWRSETPNELRQRKNHLSISQGARYFAILVMSLEFLKKISTKAESLHTFRPWLIFNVHFSEFLPYFLCKFPGEYFVKTLRASQSSPGWIKACRRKTPKRLDLLKMSKDY